MVTVRTTAGGVSAGGCTVPTLATPRTGQGGLMRTSSTLVTATTVAASALLLAGCGSLSSSVNTTAANTPAAKSTAKAGGKSGGSSSKPAGIGDTVNVNPDSRGKPPRTPGTGDPP